MELIKLTSVIRVGSSLAVIIPVGVCRELNYQRGDQIAFCVYGNDVIAMWKLSDDDIRSLRPPLIDIEQR